MEADRKRFFAQKRCCCKEMFSLHEIEEYFLGTLKAKIRKVG